MNKIVQYLNQHIRGEATASTPVLRAMSTDGSVLSLKPQLVAFPHNTNDIRKIARFASQLAEKKHALPLTARGGGTNPTGAALGSGATLALAAHMNQIFEFDAKQKQLRLQPGVSTHAVNQALALHGQTVVGLPDSVSGTVGGAIATGVSSHGTATDYVDRLEVVLASGDVIQTERLSKRELNRRIGKTGAEGEIYRQVDKLIEENKQLIDSELSTERADFDGYGALARVKRKDGSLDLTPLFVGSAGTLGIISELILKTDFVSFEKSQAVIAFSSDEEARDLFEAIRKIEPHQARYFDGTIFDTASGHGVSYPAYSEMNEKGAVAAVIYVSFTDFNERQRTRKLKRLLKLVEKATVKVASDESHSTSELESVLRAGIYGSLSEPRHDDTVPLFEGFHIPAVQAESFIGELRALASKLGVELPLSIDVIGQVYSLRAMLQLSKVGDRQKIFKLSAQVSELILTHKGTVFTSGIEGRLHAPLSGKRVSAEVADLYTKLRMIFDPHHLLNPGVKEEVPLKDVVAMLRTDYDVLPSLSELPGRYI